ncbi:hypothetical protein M0R45_004391 [Rubus argutus]|uniref:Uncharacterized protein n=1 Tax=Rubus argutus TaxID=59490 RepID=A0AAW1YJN4_RUBAR
MPCHRRCLEFHQTRARIPDVVTSSAKTQLCVSDQIKTADLLSRRQAPLPCPLQQLRPKLLPAPLPLLNPAAPPSPSRRQSTAATARGTSCHVVAIQSCFAEKDKRLKQQRKE